ncbi:hypothetical protein ACFLRH_01805 [Actinomycetota bacterium]
MPRPDVIAALETLSAPGMHSKWEQGERTWPHLDDAIHWLIDDTGLDVYPATSATQDVYLFSSDEEARLVQSAVDMLGALIDELGDVSADHYVRHGNWGSVAEACRRAHEVMTAGL